MSKRQISKQMIAATLHSIVTNRPVRIEVNAKAAANLIHHKKAPSTTSRVDYALWATVEAEHVLRAYWQDMDEIAERRHDQEEAERREAEEIAYLERYGDGYPSDDD